MSRVAIDPEVAARVRIGTVEAPRIENGPAGPALSAEIALAVGRIAGEFAGLSPGAIPGLAPARRLYRSFGIDPTSTRPSSEALVRRILQGKPFPSVSAAVDVANLCSVAFLLPIGLYDVAKIGGEVLLRRGWPGESYPGIRKETVHLEGRPVLADTEGPFGNPTSDSLRASVDAKTTGLLLVIFAPHDYPEVALERHLGDAREAVARHLVPNEG